MTRLYVGNLPFSATAEEVQEAFKAHGTVKDVRLVMDRATGRSRGFAFVTMGSAEEAARAIEKMEGALLAGRPMRVSEAQERPQRTERPPSMGGMGGFPPPFEERPREGRGRGRGPGRGNRRPNNNQGDRRGGGRRDRW